MLYVRLVLVHAQVMERYILNVLNVLNALKGGDENEKAEATYQCLPAAAMLTAYPNQMRSYRTSAEMSSWLRQR